MSSLLFAVIVGSFSVTVATTFSFTEYSTFSTTKSSDS